MIKKILCKILGHKWKLEIEMKKLFVLDYEFYNDECVRCGLIKKEK